MGSRRKHSSVSAAVESKSDSSSRGSSIALGSELFALAVHPSRPLVAAGLASGHVYTYDIETDPRLVWSTRRHKGSCRTLAFADDGNLLLSAGTDGIVKVAASESGQVSAKVRVPISGTDDLDIKATCLHVLNPQTFLIASESGKLHTFDTRDWNTSAPAQTFTPHEDYISAITSLSASDAATMVKQFVSTGATTLAVTDIRRGVVAQSEDQEEELLCCASFTASRESKDKVIVGQADGMVTIWTRGEWEDQGGRITVSSVKRSEAESVDSLTMLPDDFSLLSHGVKRAPYNSSLAAAGRGDGCISIVRVGPKHNGQTIGETLKHDELESVTALGVDIFGRLISGGGRFVKIWADDEMKKERDSSDSDSEHDEPRKKQKSRQRPLDFQDLD